MQTDQRKPDRKYVIVRDELCGVEAAILFDDIFVHANVAKGALWHAPERTAVAAGFFGRDGDGVLHCYGRSESLNLDSRPQDEALVRKVIYG